MDSRLLSHGFDRQIRAAQQIRAAGEAGLIQEEAGIGMSTARRSHCRSETNRLAAARAGLVTGEGQERWRKKKNGGSGTAPDPPQ